MMINLKKWVILSSLGFSLSGALFANPLADGTSDCGVPVCDVRATIDAVSALDANKRGEYALKLQADFKKEKNPEVLENLYVYGKELRDLYQTLMDRNGDDEWIFRAANDFVSGVILNLTRYSDFDAGKFSTYYQELAGQSSRYNMIAFWVAKVDNIEDATILNDLSIFARNARAYSLKVEDEDWVPREATSLLIKVTEKLMLLDPVHEGQYELKVKATGARVGKYELDQMTIVQSCLDGTLQVSFVNSEYSYQGFLFKEAELIGNIISGKTINALGQSAALELTFDRSTGNVQGTIETTLATLNFTGQQMISTRDAFMGVTPYKMSEEDILGRLRGTWGDLDGYFLIKRFKEYIYTATFVSEEDQVIVHFRGKFFEKSGVLSLSSESGIKVVMSLRNIDDKLRWRGYSFSVKGSGALRVRLRPIKK